MKDNFSGNFDNPYYLSEARRRLL